MPMAGDRPFRDRADAGRVLAKLVASRGPWPNALVLGLPRGGVPVAAEVAAALQAPLDVCVVRKIGVPRQPELAMGAVGPQGITVSNADVLRACAITDEMFAAGRAQALEELEAKERAYRGDRGGPVVAGRTVIVVDDGLATGATMRAAVRALAQLGPEAVVVAVPVGAPETIAELSADPAVRDVLCACAPEQLRAVGAYYEDFGATSDEQVRALLTTGGDTESPCSEPPIRWRQGGDGGVK
jgi:predicted phosphoribosyltransferase